MYRCRACHTSLVLSMYACCMCGCQRLKAGGRKGLNSSPWPCLRMPTQPSIWSKAWSDLCIQASSEQPVKGACMPGTAAQVKIRQCISFHLRQQEAQELQGHSGNIGLCCRQDWRVKHSLGVTGQVLLDMVTHHCCVCFLAHSLHWQVLRITAIVRRLSMQISR